MLTFITTGYCTKSFAQEEILLYPGGAAESNGLTERIERAGEWKADVNVARLFAYPAPKEKATGAAVVICPGGGYAGIAFVKEGDEFARWLNERGISAFVLHYRMPATNYEIPLKDAQTALAFVRHNAKKWHLKRNKIGIAGFSAGGHLAATAGTQFSSADNRPAFMILVYPVITMDAAVTHGGSRNNLIGKNPSEELVRRFSAEQNVNKKTPPAFLTAAEDDRAVPVQNSRSFCEALQANKVPATLKVYQKGGHGFGLRPQGTDSDKWTEALDKWLRENSLAYDDSQLRFGLIADIQYADCDPSGSRFYRNSLAKLDAAISALNRQNVQFTINLGDVTDREFERNIDSVLVRLKQLNHKLINLSGNHDYNGVGNERILYKKLDIKADYYSFKKKDWVFIFLNTNEISDYANPSDTEKAQELSAMLQQIELSGGRQGASYNGGIGKKQLQWLNSQLQKAEKAHHKVLIFAHHPLFPESVYTALNNTAILNVIENYSCVKAIFAGHRHTGSFAYYKDIPVITAEGMIETENDNAFGVVKLYKDKIVVEGQGRMSSHELKISKF